MSWLFILLIIVAILLIAFILFLVVMSYIERQEMRWLAQNGTLIQARVRELHSLVPAASAPQAAGAEHPTSLPPTSRHIIVAEWTDPATEETYTFHSHPIRQLPEKYREGEPIAVVIDPERPTRYTLEDELRTYQEKHRSL